MASDEDSYSSWKSRTETCLTACFLLQTTTLPPTTINFKQQRDFSRVLMTALPTQQR